MKKTLGICIVLAFSATATGCFIVSNPPEEPEPAATTAAPPAADPPPADPAPTATEEPKKPGLPVPNLAGADEEKEEEEE